MLFHIIALELHCYCTHIHTVHLFIRMHLCNISEDGVAHSRHHHPVSSLADGSTEIESVNQEGMIRKKIYSMYLQVREQCNVSS